MQSQNGPLYAIAAATLVVGLAFAGVSVSMLLLGLLILVGPLSMLFRMRGMRGGQDETDHKTDRPKDEHHRPTAGRP